MNSCDSPNLMKTQTDWLELPKDAMIQIFTKLGPVDLLLAAQHVCSSWRAIAREPQLYCIVHLSYFGRHQTFDDIVRKAAHTSYKVRQDIERSLVEAIDRSCEEIVEFSTTYFCTEAMFKKLMHGAPRLKRLRLIFCNNISEELLIDVVKNLPLLEEVEFRHWPLTKDVIVAVGCSCPHLRSFVMNGWGGMFTREEVENDEVLAMVENMNPGLRNLSLFGYWMNNDGLEAILDRFPQLESLDLRRCFNIKVEGDLLKKCQRIKTLRLPEDSTDDYDLKPYTNPMVNSEVEYYETDSSDDYDLKPNRNPMVNSEEESDEEESDDDNDPEEESDEEESDDDKPNRNPMVKSEVEYYETDSDEEESDDDSDPEEESDDDSDPEESKAGDDDKKLIVHHDEESEEDDDDEDEESEEESEVEEDDDDTDDDESEEDDDDESEEDDDDDEEDDDDDDSDDEY